MFRFSMMLVGIVSITPLFAQHPFYIQSFESGRLAMANEDWAMADEYLEIAAFGLLEEPQILGDIYVRLVILSKAQGQEDVLKSRRAKLDRLMEGQLRKPEKLSAALWDRYLVIIGAKEPPPPPIPKDTSQLETFVDNNPKNPNGWVALARLYLEKKDLRKAKRTLGNALNAHPTNESLLELALIYSLNHNRRKAKDYGTALLRSHPNNDRAHEYFGNEAVKNKNYSLAQTHYSKVNKENWDETKVLKKRMNEALVKAQQARVEKAKQEAAKKEADRKAKLDREKREADREAKLAKDQLEKERKAQLEKEKREQARQARLDRQKDAKKQTADEEPKKVATKKDPGKTQPKKKRDRKPNTKKPEPTATTTKTVFKSGKKETPSRSMRKPTGTNQAAKNTHPSLDAKIAAAKAQVKANPRDGQSKFALLDLYFEKNDLKSAKKLLRDLGKSNVNDPRYAVVFARYNYLSRKYRLVIRALGNRQTLSDPLRYYLGLSYFRSNKLAEAQKALSGLDRKTFPNLVAVDKDLNARLPKTSRLKKNNSGGNSQGAVKKPEPSGESELAQSLRLIDRQISAEDWRSAKRSIRKAYSDYPKNLDVQYFRGRMFLEQGKFKKAAQLLYNLSSNGFKRREVYYYGGLAFHREGDQELAKYMFKMADIEGTRFKSEIASIIQPEPMKTKPVREPNPRQ